MRSSQSHTPPQTEGFPKRNCVPVLETGNLPLYSVGPQPALMNCIALWCNSVYSWRLSEELKSDLEREAHLRKVSVSSVLETAVRDWLKKSNTDATDDQAQRRLHTAAARCLGVLTGLNSRRAETARELVRRRLRRRYAR